MKIKKLICNTIIVIILVSLLTACGAPNVTPTPTPSTAPTVSNTPALTPAPTEKPSVKTDFKAGLTLTEAFKDPGNWGITGSSTNTGGPIKMDLKDGIMTLTAVGEADSGFAYTKEGSDVNNKLVKLDVKTTFKGGDGWAGIAFRIADPGLMPWDRGSDNIFLNNCYLFLWQESLIHLQIFKKGENADKFAPQTVSNNGTTKNDTNVKIQAGAINETDGVRLIFKVDGKKVFDYLDKDKPIKEASLIGLYTYKNDTVISRSK